MRVSAWEQTPETLRALGWQRDAGRLFARLVRLGSGDDHAPLLGREARAFVAENLDLSLPSIASAVPSSDGSTRLVLELAADRARIETVHMPRSVRRSRVTVCLSTQVGCAMGCTFCKTATMGLVRNLEAHEIVGQLLAVMRELGPRSADSLNLVFMGMGEPLHNVDALVRALDVLCEPSGLGIAPSRITVSTVGHVAGLARLARARWLPELAVSVNGATDVIRRGLMPINRRWPLEALRAALLDWPRRPHQKITLEYVLIAGVNDDFESADRLAAWATGIRHVLNVIPFNAWEGSPFREPPPEIVSAFVARLRERGCLVKVRRTRGRDARAACGTLAA